MRRTWRGLDTSRLKEKYAHSCRRTSRQRKAVQGQDLSGGPSLTTGWPSRGVNEGGECGGTGDEDGLLE